MSLLSGRGRARGEEEGEEYSDVCNAGSDISGCYSPFHVIYAG